MEHTLAQTRIETLRSERDAGRRSALDEAIAPLLELTPSRPLSSASATGAWNAR